MLGSEGGNTFRLPRGEALARTFGEQQNGPTLARGSILYDIGHGLVVDTRVAATCVGEHELAIEHLAAARPGDLLLYDRGYPALWFFTLHLAKGDEDPGRSGSTAEGRPGFQRLVAEVGLDHVGLVLGIEISRLARSSRDWYQLLEVCAVFSTLIADADGLYDPTTYNDRLLLGLKGVSH